MSSPKSRFYRNNRPFPSLQTAPRPPLTRRVPLSAVIGALVTGCATGPIDLGSVLPAIGLPGSPGATAPAAPGAGGESGLNPGTGAPGVGKPALPTPPPPKPPVPPKREPDVIIAPPDGAPEPVPLKPPVASPKPTPIYPGYPYPVDPRQSVPTQPSGATFLADQAVRVLQLSNDARVAAGLPALAGDPALDQVARTRSQDMGDRNYFSHTTPENTTIFDMLPTFGVSYRSAGENIAMNTASTTNTASTAFDAWMNSAGHKANILRTTFGRLGVGVYRTPAGRTYLTQVFTD